MSKLEVIISFELEEDEDVTEDSLHEQDPYTLATSLLELYPISYVSIERLD